MSELLKMLAEISQEENPKANIHPEEQLTRLQEAKTLYDRKNPFEIGDVIHPRADSPISGSENPHIVVATSETQEIPQSTNLQGGNWEIANKNDLIVLTCMDGHIVPFAVASWFFEPYTPPKN